MPPSAVVTERIEKGQDQNGAPVVSFTQKVLNATSTDDITPPSDARNIKAVLAGGELTLTYDIGGVGSASQPDGGGT